MNNAIELNDSNASIVAIADMPGNYIIKYHDFVICSMSFKNQGYVDIEEIKAAAAKIVDLEITRQRIQHAR